MSLYSGGDTASMNRRSPLNAGYVTPMETIRSAFGYGNGLNTMPSTTL